MLKIEHLSFAYPSSPSLFHDLSATLSSTDVLAIIGRNGAGKSTLLRLLNGLLKPIRGHVELNGKNLSELKIHEIARHIGTVFQSPEQQLFASTVEEEVAFGPKQLGFKKQRVEEKVAAALDRTGLSSFASYHPLDLDYASRRFLTLACVLANNPDILLLDEPQRGLDRAWTERLEQIISEERQSGGAVILVCHDMDFVERNATDVLPLGGESVKQRATADFFFDKAAVNEISVETPWKIRIQRALDLNEMSPIREPVPLFMPVSGGRE
ncbi:ABC transporter ATP-binding protein [Brucella sp. NBRC 12950]|uniref:energy-coupling factor ABC transporter ATP-binding protein n=1 Tax=Brucella sp. NBRC 12950 TaxID=2994518 RepID=UPI0024A594A4|nr:ABC transporter ATP-binding protein [Brucella sp. NBRC 12950]GLU29163.1 ABC transporter ATP-binding protein [Brucella sp. NBRC 12950]